MSVVFLGIFSVMCMALTIGFVIVTMKQYGGSALRNIISYNKEPQQRAIKIRVSAQHEDKQPICAEHMPKVTFAKNLFPQSANIFSRKGSHNAANNADGVTDISWPNAA